MLVRILLKDPFPFQRHFNVLCRNLTLFDEAVAWIFAGNVSSHSSTGT